MPHYYIPPESISGCRFVIAGAEAHHLVNVRRCQPGSTINLFDGTGKSYLARIDAVGKDELSGTIISAEQVAPPAVRLHLFQAVPKGDRFDWLVEKAAELGVAAITPLITGRSVLKELSPARSARWERLSQAASKQSGRTDIMDVTAPARLRDAADGLSADDLNLMPWEEEEALSLDDAFRSRSTAVAVNVFIGPEGGFTPDEAGYARGKGIIPVTLGRRILRSETAGIVSAVLVMHLAGEYGKERK